MTVMIVMSVVVSMFVLMLVVMSMFMGMNVIVTMRGAAAPRRAPEQPSAETGDEHETRALDQRHGVRYRAMRETEKNGERADGDDGGERLCEG